MRLHLHDYSDWQDVGPVETTLGGGGAMVQQSRCVVCGKLRYRRSNSVYSSGILEAYRLLQNTFGRHK